MVGRGGTFNYFPNNMANIKIIVILMLAIKVNKKECNKSTYLINKLKHINRGKHVNILIA